MTREGIKLIKSWKELAECTSETHDLVVNLRSGSGRIKPKDPTVIYEESWKNNFYLFTHTFYGNNYKESTRVLQDCGFNVQLENWDGKTEWYKGK